MKCISCGTDNNLRDRTSQMGRCKSCNHRFAFEPTAMPVNTKLTDPFFAKLLTDLSVNNTLFFTPRQLYYLLDKRLRARAGQGGFLGSLIAYLGCGPAFMTFASIFVSGFLRLPFNWVLTILLSVHAAFAIWSTAQNSLSRQVNRRTRQGSVKTLKVIAGVLLLVGLPASIISQSWLGVVTSIGLGLGAVWASIDRQRRQRQVFDDFLIDRGQFDLWLNQWISINGVPDKLLPEPQTDNLMAAVNPDVTAYSFDRLIVCDSPDIAQLLISNNFHFEHNCAILTIDGYPHNIFDTTMEMVRRNPDLKVFALHDCSPQSLQLIQRLRQTETWFPDPNVPIIDVGIMPSQILDNLDATIRQSATVAQAAQGLPGDVRASLNTEGLQWLDAGCYLDLESFPPQKLLQILHQAIQNSQALTNVDGGDMVLIDDYGSGGGFYMAESFG